MLAVRWYLRCGLSYRDLEELLSERGVDVDHVTLFRWVQRFTPILIDAADPYRYAIGERWYVDEAYVKVVTDRAAGLAKAVGELAPDALHNTVQYANNRVEADHGRLKARLRPMRGLKRDRTANVVIKGHAFIQNVRRGHYELGTDTAHQPRIAAAFDVLLTAIR
jgi:IS6 family transposase